MLGTREGDDAFEVAFVESTKRPSYNTLLFLRHRPRSISLRRAPVSGTVSRDTAPKETVARSTPSPAASRAAT
jgi:hypothetical protein